MSSDSDAEWIDVNNEFGPPKPIGPNNPPPRPRTTTLRPSVNFPTKGPRPRRPFPRNSSHDAPDQLPPGSNATVISVSVVSALVVVALILSLLYLVILRKKLRKVQKSQHDSQYALRVEDVAHIDIGDSSKLYVNTTDLQKLVSSVRIKNKKPPPSIPYETNYPDVVKVGKQPVPLPDNESEFPIESEIKTSSYVNVCDETVQPEKSDNIYENITDTVGPTPVRRAPPPPSNQLLADNTSEDVTSSLTQQKFRKMPSAFTIQKSLSSNVEPPTTQSNKKPLVPQHKPNFIHTSNSKNPSPPRQHPPPPPLSSKPVPKVNARNIQRPPSPPNTSKTSSDISQATKPLLPRLQMNLKPTTASPYSSGFSTPDTAVSYLNDTNTPTQTDPFEPETLSVSKKRALLEGIINKEVGAKHPMK